VDVGSFILYGITRVVLTFYTIDILLSTKRK